MAISQKLFPSGAIEVSFRVANTAPKDAEREFLSTLLSMAGIAGYGVISGETLKNDSRDLSRVYTVRFSDKLVPSEEAEAA